MARIHKCVSIPEELNEYIKDKKINLSKYISTMLEKQREEEKTKNGS